MVSSMVIPPFVRRSVDVPVSWPGPGPASVRYRPDHTAAAIDRLVGQTDGQPSIPSACGQGGGLPGEPDIAPAAVARCTSISATPVGAR